jgi:UDP-N-acetylmuramoyl-tripeptide--D-alanyl-D-alanine ligase
MLNKIYQHYLQVRSVSTDSRNIPSGCIYFALKGESFDGNAFAIEAISKGASMAVVDDANVAALSAKCILVENALSTLQELAGIHRGKLNIPIIGLTGSNGKTTSKELLAAVLSRKFSTQFTRGNLNNHIGVPLSVLSILPEHEIAVIEMGANHQKEIAFLCSICKPDYGYITNFGLAHLEGFGGPEGVIAGKSELYAHLRESKGIAWVNVDDQKQMELSEGISRKGFSFCGKEGSESFELKLNANTCTIGWRGQTITSHLVGDYNATNIAYAIMGGIEFGVPEKDIKAAIESYLPENKRSQLMKTERNTIIVDCYNANPSSMQSAVENAYKLFGKEAILILGDMFELGDSSKDLHEEVLNQIKDLGIERAMLVGTHFSSIPVAAPILTFEKTEDLFQYLESNPIIAAKILLKGSRGMALEKFLPLL